jgi:hypothetical protein
VIVAAPAGRRFMREYQTETAEGMDEEIIHSGINKDVLFLLWFLFVLFHAPLFRGIGVIFGFLAGLELS